MPAPAPSPGLKLKEPLATALVVAAALAAGVTVWLLGSDGAPLRDHGWFKWALLGGGIFLLVDSLVDRAQKVDFKRINRVEGLKYLLGPAGARILFATIAGAMLGGAAAIFTRG